MRTTLFPTRLRHWTTAIAIAMLLLLLLPGAAFARANAPASGGGFYQQTNLVSDIHGVAKFTDPRLVNPWGISYSPTSPFWVSDNGTGLSTLYTGDGKRVPLVVTVPPPAGVTQAAPTGNIYNPFNGTDPNNFVVSQNGVSGPSIFLFDTEDGTISGWNPNVNLNSAILVVDNSSSRAVYKGLAIGSNGSGEFLYAANFRAGTIDVFDANFAPAHLSGSFSDSGIPKGYAPFNIQNIGGNLYVTYAKQNKAKHDDVSGLGHGFLDIFDTSGNFIQRLVTRGKLNSPWGMAIAPANFGQFSNDLLVGNFGDGFINVFDPSTGVFLGKLRNQRNMAIRIDGLWALIFGNGGQGGQTNQLFFTAGIGGEQHGLFGVIEAM